MRAGPGVTAMVRLQVLGPSDPVEPPLTRHTLQGVRHERLAQAPYELPYVPVDKTTVYLPKEMKRRLRAKARQLRISEAELIREGLKVMLAPRPRFPLFDSGDPTFASRVDEILAEGFGLEGMPPEMAQRYRQMKRPEKRTARR